MSLFGKKRASSALSTKRRPYVSLLSKRCNAKTGYSFSRILRHGSGDVPFSDWHYRLLPTSTRLSIGNVSALLVS